MVRPLDLLHRLHNRLLEILSTAAPLFAPSHQEVDLVGLRYLRDELVQIMTAHRRYVAKVLIAEAERSGDPEIICHARAILVGSQQSAAILEAFHANWADRDPLANWAEFRLKAMLTIKQMRQQVLLSRDWLWLIDERTAQFATAPIPTSPLTSARRH